MFALKLPPMRSWTIKPACMPTPEHILYRRRLVGYSILQDCTVFFHPLLEIFAVFT